MHPRLPRDLKFAGEFANLEPLLAEHADALAEAAADGQLWKLHFTGVPSRDTVADYIMRALDAQAAGTQQPFLVRRLSDNKIVGSTRFYDIEPVHRNLAIGYTWYAASAQRTAINTECKLMLLRYAFEELNCISVAFHTDNENSRSQAAIARLGGHNDGVLRNHKIRADGTVRDTWCFSIIDSEWPSIDEKLTARLRQA